MRLARIRRFLAVTALALWQGGFTFYAGFVVPIGQRVLGSHIVQGFITREVTLWLNAVGGAALVPLAWELLSTRQKPGGFVQLACGALLALGLAALWFLHGQMDAHLDLVERRILDREAFYLLHRVYLWISTAQWATAGVLTWSMLGRPIPEREET